MFKNATIILIFSILCNLPSLVLAERNASDKTIREDKVKFEQLIRDRSQTQSELSRMKESAVKERKHKGKESLETSSKIQSKIQQLERIENRLMILQFRYPDWEIPKKDESQADGTYVKNRKEEIFQDAKQMVTEKFKEEAQKIGQTIQLPITRLAINHTRMEGETNG